MFGGLSRQQLHQQRREHRQKVLENVQLSPLADSLKATTTQQNNNTSNTLNALSMGITTTPNVLSSSSPDISDDEISMSSSLKRRDSTSSTDSARKSFGAARRPSVSFGDVEVIPVAYIYDRSFFAEKKRLPFRY